MLKGSLINLLLLILITTQTTTAICAEANSPVKLAFENISPETVNALLNEHNVSEIIASSWNNANEKPSSNPPNGKIAKYDLNGDGLEEVFLYLSGKGMCGRGGCHLIIFQFSKKNNKLEYKTTRSSSDDILILGNLVPNGYANLAIRLMDGISLSKADEYTLYQWKNGNLVQTSETMRFQHRENNCDENLPRLF